MKWFVIFLGIAALCATIGCDGADNTGINGTGTIVYFSSFESDRDTAGWDFTNGGVSSVEGAPGCGSRALAVTGGCIQPVASLDLPSGYGAGDYVVSCWAKCSSDSTGLGSVMLVVNGSWPEGDFIELRVTGGEWRFYATQEPLHCSSSRSLRLQLLSGGFVASDPLHIDHIKVEKLE